VGARGGQTGFGKSCWYAANYVLFMLLANNNTGLAKDLLELLMDAPQMDAIWATYQEGPDEEMEDDEEVEARRLAANVI
jgi:hypothetical protein